MMHPIPEVLSCSQCSLTVSQLESSHKGQYKTHPILFLCAEHPCKVTQCMQFLMSYCLKKSAQPSVSLKVQKDQTMVIIKFSQNVSNIPVKLQHDIGSF